MVLVCAVCLLEETEDKGVVNKEIMVGLHRRGARLRGKRLYQSGHGKFTYASKESGETTLDRHNIHSIARNKRPDIPQL